MTQEYNNISVFKAKPSDNAKAPLFNVAIEFADGMKWRGGLWKRVSKNGLEYLSGSLDEDDGKSGGSKKQNKPNDDMIDW